MAVPNDAPVIAAVLYESFLEYKSFYTHEAFNATAPNTDQIQDRMKEGPIWVALSGGTVVGTVAAVPKPERYTFEAWLSCLRPGGKESGNSVKAD